MPDLDAHEATDVFSSIRTSCARVAELANSVRIRQDRVHGYARDLLDSHTLLPALDLATHFVGSVEETVAFFVSLDAINFGSGYFPHLTKREGMSGYFTIASGLSDHFRAKGVILAPQLATATPECCAAIFSQSLDHPAIRELMSAFAQAWNDLGNDLLERFDGSFTQLIESANHSAAQLVTALACQPLFHDVAYYQDFEVPLYKRAQLLASDLALALPNAELGRFDDLDKLTIFADNLVPHVLRMDGILEYDPRLLDRIEREELIPSGSPEEIEIRACGVAAVEAIRAAAQHEGMQFTSRDLDQILWHRGQDPAYKRTAKRHRTRSVFY